MKKFTLVVVIGAGGHAKVIVDILKLAQGYEPFGCLDPAVLPGTDVLGVIVLGTDDLMYDLYENGIRHAFVAIGDNLIRKKVISKVLNCGFTLVNAIHPQTSIASSVQLDDGGGIAVMAGSVINPDAQIGCGSIINTNASIDHDTKIEAFCHIAPGSSLAGNARVGEGAFLGVGTKVSNDITIGPWSILGAGAVVIKNIPGHCLAVGIPAVIKKKLSEIQ